MSLQQKAHPASDQASASSEKHINGTLEIEITTRCNLQCAPCPQAAFQDTWINRNMPWGIFKKIIDSAQSFENINFQGWGEPLLHPEIVEMAAEIESLPARLILSTNGVLPVPHELLRSVHTLVFRLGIGKARTYELQNPGFAFNRTLFNISQVMHWRNRTGRKGPSVILSFIKNRFTLDELPEYLSMAAKLKVDQVTLREPRFHTRKIDELAALPGKLPVHRVREKEELLVSTAKEKGIHLVMDSGSEYCPFNPRYDLFVNWKGQVSPCRYNHLPLTSGKFTVVKNGSFQDLSPLYFGYLNNLFEAKLWQRKTSRLFGFADHLRDVSGKKEKKGEAGTRSRVFAHDCSNNVSPEPGNCGLCF